MPTIENARLLRIIVGESDRHDGRPLYEAIVLKARELGLAGATVTRAVMGFGASSHLHTAKILRLSLDLPMVIEIVDRPEQLDKLLPFLDSAVHGGLVAFEDLRVLHYRGTEPKA
jgi:PII-like signaling protein